METVKQIIPLLLSFSLAGLVLGVGLNAERGDILYVLRRPKLLFKVILAVDVIPPLVAGLLVAFLPIEPVIKAGIMLMAISPVPPLVPGQEMSVGARKEFAYGVYVAMALLTIIAVPLVFTIASHLFGRNDTVSVALMARTVLLNVLLPLAFGILIRTVAPKFAHAIVPILYKISMALIVLAFLPILASMWPAIRDMIGNGTLLAMAAVVICTLTGGHLLGGPDLRDRATLAVASTVRHPGIAMMIANATFQDARVSAAVLLYMIVGLVVSVPYHQWVKHDLPSTPAAA